MKLPKFLQESPNEATARRLYARAVERARQPVFYVALEVPDTPDGRFDLIAMHVMLLLRRLRRERNRAAEPAQALFDYMFADMDQNLREMGIGDMSIGKRIKGLARNFYGRIAAYDAGLDSEESQNLEDAVRRNVFRKMQPKDVHVMALAEYMRSCDAQLCGVPLDVLLSGRFAFAPLPATAETSVP